MLYKLPLVHRKHSLPSLPPRFLQPLLGVVLVSFCYQTFPHAWERGSEWQFLSQGQGHLAHDIFWTLLDVKKTCLADRCQQLCSLLQLLWKERFKMHYNTLYTIGPTPRGKKCCLEHKTFLRTNMTALVGAHLVDAMCSNKVFWPYHSRLTTIVSD